MKVKLEKACCIVTKEKGDKKIREGQWGSAESCLLYRIKNILNKQGYDLIKKRMWKDGNMVDDEQLYIRSRKVLPKNKPFCIYNQRFALECAAEEYEKEGTVILAKVNLF